MKPSIAALAGAAFLVAGIASAQAAQPSVQELPIPGVSSQQGGKLYQDDSDLLQKLPDANELVEPKGGVSPQAVYRSGCIFRPYQTLTYTLYARRIVLYRVVPSRFFDVTLRVNYVNLRSFYRDAYFAGGAESLRISGPVSPRLVRVTIGGYRASTGCFAFSATP